MTSREYPRAEPCTKCGDPVTVVEMQSRGVRPGRQFAQLTTKGYRHAQVRTMGDRVDDECQRD